MVSWSSNLDNWGSMDSVGYNWGSMDSMGNWGMDSMGQNWGMVNSMVDWGVDSMDSVNWGMVDSMVKSTIRSGSSNSKESSSNKSLEAINFEKNVRHVDITYFDH